MTCQSRNGKLLRIISIGWPSMLGLAKHFDCPEASIRRSIHDLRQAGYYIVVKGGHAHSYGVRSDLIYQDPSDNLGGVDDVQE